MTERQACALLGLKRARLYELRREWLRQRATWALTSPRRAPRRWRPEITTWLHRECQYLQDEAVHYRGRFNFAVLAEAAHQRFGTILSRSGVRRWAIGQGYYRDVGRPRPWRRERLRTDEGEIQFRRILQTLDVGVVYAHSPEAKGKIEKRFDYFQRRLPPLCERYRITDVADARPVLEDLIGYYNEQRRHQETEEIPAARWDGALQRGQGRQRQMPEIVDLALLFTVQYERLVHSDGKVRFLGRTWPVSAPAGSRVTVDRQSGVEGTER